MTFYNTTHIDGKELEAARAAAASREALVLQFFANRPGELFTPWEVHDRLPNPAGTPITSTRKCITVLTDSGHLTKTRKRKVGNYGKKNYCWCLSGTYTPPPAPGPQHVQGELF